MKIALGQTGIVWEDKDKNLAICESYIEKAKDDKADIIFFPEMSLTGFSMNIEKTKENYNYTVQKMERLARENSIAIGFGWVEEMGYRARNKYTVLDSKGKVLADYAKIHPFSHSREDKYFVAGGSLSKFDFMGFKIGVLLCYDLRFPEVFQALSRDCDAIVLPANWPEKRRKHWKVLLKARAIENQIYVFGVNCVGQLDGQYYSGDSCIINPNGEILYSLTKQKGIVTGEIENDVRKYRKEFPTREDRRPDFYKSLF